MNIENQGELIPLQLGDVLRGVRLHKALSLDTLAAEIKVRCDVLRAIESDETSHIPAVYLKGYIRSYARRLGISAAEIDGYMAAVNRDAPPVQTIFKEGPPRHSADRWLKSTSYVLASAVVIALVWQFTNEAVRFSQGEPLLGPASDQASSAPATPGEQTASNQADDTPSAATPKTHLRASIASMNPSRENLTSAYRSAAEGAWAAIGQQQSAAAPVPPVVAGTHALSIVTSADSWVEIFDGTGAKIEMDLLRAGSRREYNGTAPFRMLLGRASSVEVFHNGEKVDLGPFTRGNVARLNLGEASQETTPLPEVEVPSGLSDGETEPSSQG